MSFVYAVHLSKSNFLHHVEDKQTSGLRTIRFSYFEKEKYFIYLAVRKSRPDLNDDVSDLSRLTSVHRMPLCHPFMSRFVSVSVVVRVRCACRIGSARNACVTYEREFQITREKIERRNI